MSRNTRSITVGTALVIALCALTTVAMAQPPGAVAPQAGPGQGIGPWAGGHGPGPGMGGAGMRPGMGGPGMRAGRGGPGAGRGQAGPQARRGQAGPQARHRQAGPPAVTPTITASGKYVYVLAGPNLYKYEAKTLELVAQTQLPRPERPDLANRHRQGRGGGRGAARTAPPAEPQK